MKFTLGRKLGLAFALVLAVMACSSGLTYWKIAEMRSQEELMIERQDSEPDLFSRPVAHPISRRAGPANLF